MDKNIKIRAAEAKDTGLILDMIKELAEYEKLSHEVVATEELLGEWIFTKGKAEVLIAEFNGETAGFALFFHNFSTFLGRAGIFLEDIFIKKEFRGNGIGSMLFKELAKLTVERECGRLDWNCLDWNESSINFYLKMGAVPQDGWKTYRLTGDSLHSLAKII